MGQNKIVKLIFHAEPLAFFRTYSIKTLSEKEDLETDRKLQSMFEYYDMRDLYNIING
jgi:hypothetical protein